MAGMNPKPYEPPRLIELTKAQYDEALRTGKLPEPPPTLPSVAT